MAKINDLTVGVKFIKCSECVREEVPNGRWIDRVAVKGEVYCSECGTIEAVRDSNFKTRYCPNCGARMAGGVG